MEETCSSSRTEETRSSRTEEVRGIIGEIASTHAIERNGCQLVVDAWTVVGPLEAVCNDLTARERLGCFFVDGGLACQTADTTVYYYTNFFRPSSGCVLFGYVRPRAKHPRRGTARAEATLVLFGLVENSDKTDATLEHLRVMMGHINMMAAAVKD
jgi:hypothetical protein